MRSTLIMLAFASLLASLFAVAFICPLLEIPLQIKEARIACLAVGALIAWICLSHLPRVNRQ